MTLNDISIKNQKPHMPEEEKKYKSSAKVDEYIRIVNGKKVTVKGHTRHL